MSRIGYTDLPPNFANAKKKRAMRDPRVQGGAGNPDFQDVPQMDVPRGTSPVPVAPPNVAGAPAASGVRTISAIPAGQTEQTVRNQLQQAEMQRRRIVMAALNTNDPAQREDLIAQRHQLEPDIRALGAVLPRSYVDPNSPEAQANHDRLQMQLRTELARRAAQPAPHTTEPDAAYAVGQQMAAGTGADIPMSDPTDELRRQEILRLGAREPTLAGSGTDAYVTTRAQMEKNRRNMLSPPEQPSPDAGTLPPLDPAAADKRFAQARNIQEGYQPEAAGVMDRAQQERAFRENMKSGAMKLAEADQQRAIEGNDAQGIDRQIALLAGKTRLAQAQRESELARPVDAGSRIGTAASTIEQGVPERVGGARGALGGEGVSPVISTILAGTPLGPAFALLNRWAMGGESKISPEQLDLSFRDVETSIPNLTFEQRTELSNRLRAIRNQIAGQSGSAAWDDRIQRILSQIEPGS